MTAANDDSVRRSMIVKVNCPRQRGVRSVLGLFARMIFNLRTFGVQIYALLLAAKDPRTPWHVRIAGLLVVAYLLSPLDMVPAVVPFFGLVDDLIIVPLGLKAVSSFIPAQVQDEAQYRAGRSAVAHPKFWRWVGLAFALLFLIWLAIVAALIYLIVIWIM